MPNENATLGCNRCDHGFWVNPRNSMDRRPCFTCNPQAGQRPAFRRRYRPVAPIVGPEAVIAPAHMSAHETSFAAAYPGEHGWLLAGATNGNEFAASLLRGMRRYGGLTPRQLACVQRNLSEGTPAVPVNADQAPVAPVVDMPTPPVSGAPFFNAVANIATPAPVVAPPFFIIEAGPLRTALDAAAASGLRKVRLTLGDLEFRRGFNGRIRNTEGQILVYRRVDGRWSYVGKIAADGRWLGQTPEGLVDHIRETCADPRAAASAHGHDTGYCACCRRLLTDPPSVMAGIGPVCIRRFNWGF